MSDATKIGDYLASHGATLIDNGYQVVPIRPGKKAPAPDNWQEIKSTRPLLKKWLANGYASSGVGILTKNTPAVDIDVLDAGIAAEMVAWIKEHVGDAPIRVGKAPKTLMLFTCDEPFTKVTSAYFIDPSNPVITDGPKAGKALKQRIEVLGDGQQFVAFHIHPETHQPYEWTTHDDPTNTAVLDLPILDAQHARAICDRFERLAADAGWERASNTHEGESRVRVGNDASDSLAEILPPEETPGEVARIKSALEKISGEVASGYSYEQWFAVVAALKWTRWACAEELAREWSETSSNHGDEHFNRTWKGAQKRERGREFTLGTVIQYAKDAGWDATRTVDEAEKEAEAADKIAELEGELEFVTAKDPKARKRFLKMLAAAQLTASDTEMLLEELKKITKMPLPALRKDLRLEQLGGEKPTHAGYANMFINELRERSGQDPVGVESQLYVFSKDDGVWLGKLAGDYEVQVAKSFDGREKCERRGDYIAVANHAYAISAVGCETFFEQAPVGLACEGRFYKIGDDGAIVKEALKSTHRQRILAPVRPIVGDMPLFTAFLEQTFDGNFKEEQIGLLQEIVGATILGIMAKYEKVALFKGPGRSGKGTMMKIIQSMVPNEARSAVSPFNWDGEYYLANLAGRRLNVVGELPDDEPIPAAQFKSVTGRDELTGRHPTHRPFTFRNTAAHIFNSNHFIFTKDHSETFYGRWLLLSFGNSRIGLEDGINVDLAKRIIDEELSAIMAWALQGAKRLQDRGRFVETPAHHLMMAQWQRRTSTLIEFLHDRDEVVMGPTEVVRRADFYRAYSDYCKASGRRAMGKQKLYDELGESACANLGVRFGTDSHGADVVRGASLRRADQGAWSEISPDDEL